MWPGLNNDNEKSRTWCAVIDHEVFGVEGASVSRLTGRTSWWAGREKISDELETLEHGDEARRRNLSVRCGVG
ncbi:unnamed protein product [Macrosiphum euphorbiae]|uniref:Uncharacterized protein n=1 Tax=Macrosiphum euphorbiae TaxID=13131 RepID=A0AAV0XZD5_9HEMI|nr:unnamed protein product [Macrosiphum euphorbiae]